MPITSERLLLAALALGTGCGGAGPSVEGEWGPDSTSQAFSSLDREFEQAAQADPLAALRQFAPRFVSLAAAGDPDARLWVLDSRQARDPNLAPRHLSWFLDVLRTGAGSWRLADLDGPLSNLWSIPGLQGELLDGVERFLDRSRDAHARSEVAIQLADVICHVLPDGPEQTARTRELLELVRAETDDPFWSQTAESMLAALEWQGLDRPAIDLAGHDAAGRELNLSDLRGRVVVLTFWGFW